MSSIAELIAELDRAAESGEVINVARNRELIHLIDSNEFVPRSDNSDIDFFCGRIDGKTYLDFCERHCPYERYYRCDTVALADDVLCVADRQFK